MTKLREQAGEGCHMWGELKINKVRPCRAAAHQHQDPPIHTASLSCSGRTWVPALQGTSTGTSTGPLLVASSTSRAPNPAHS